MLDIDTVQRIAEEEVSNCCDMPRDAYRVAVRQNLPHQPRMIAIYWDIAEPDVEGKYSTRATAVDFSQSEEMVHYRIRSMFAYPAMKTELYEQQDLRIFDHPDEQPPEN